MKKEDLKRALEAFLLVSASPLQIAQVKESLSIDKDEELTAAFKELKAKYESADSPFRIIEVAGGYRLGTAPDLAAYLKKWFRGRKPRLSRASLETLSIIAYKQPLTRSEIEAIRGVNVEGALGTLLDRGLIRITGRKETAGRPFCYGTTRFFLEHFGLNTLKDLPTISEFSELDLSEEDKKKINKLPSGDSNENSRVAQKDQQPR